ncbi:hypothetical protein HUJ05_001768 [Dendroctonus ponderosae]|nr:hypothetical protein HUJ05_001768 [Dendroctonus ponderosae]
MFSCECNYYKERKAMCKHIHIVIAAFGNKKTEDGPIIGSIDSADKEISIQEGLSAISQKNEKEISIQEGLSALSQENEKEISILEGLSALSQKHENSSTKISHINTLLGKLQSIDFHKKSSKRYIDPQIRFTLTKRNALRGKQALKDFYDPTPKAYWFQAPFLLQTLVLHTLLPLHKTEGIRHLFFLTQNIMSRFITPRHTKCIYSLTYASIQSDNIFLVKQLILEIDTSVEYLLVTYYHLVKLRILVLKPQVVHSLHFDLTGVDILTSSSAQNIPVDHGLLFGR